MNIAEILKQAAANSDGIRQKLLSGADARYKRRRDELQREYAAECAMIGEAFGVVEASPENNEETL
jgi:hypothetical protein